MQDANLETRLFKSKLWLRHLERERNMYSYHFPDIAKDLQKDIEKEERKIKELEEQINKAEEIE